LTIREICDKRKKGCFKFFVGGKFLLLEVINLRKSFGGLVAVDRVSFTIRRKEILSLIGPNGAGKTTLFNCISGLYSPEEGRILFGEKKEDLTKLKPHQVARLGISRTFQNIRLFANMTVAENVSVGQHTQTKEGICSALLRTQRFFEEERKIQTKTRHLLKFGQLLTKQNELAKNLPYGEQRKLEIIRALASAPTLLLLDEPAAGMNPQETFSLMSFIRKIRDEFEITVLLIEHDMKVVMNISERIVVLDYGKKIAEGKPEEIQKNQAVIGAYLGTSVCH
jgi:branched-chain amino acid transport system ATP-binding protein